MLAKDTGKKLAPETYKTNDYTFGQENGGYDILIGTQLSYECMVSICAPDAPCMLRVALKEQSLCFIV